MNDDDAEEDEDTSLPTASSSSSSSQIASANYLQCVVQAQHSTQPTNQPTFDVLIFLRQLERDARPYKERRGNVRAIAPLKNTKFHKLWKIKFLIAAAAAAMRVRVIPFPHATSTAAVSRWAAVALSHRGHFDIAGHSQSRQIPFLLGYYFRACMRGLQTRQLFTCATSPSLVHYNFLFYQSKVLFWFIALQCWRHHHPEYRLRDANSRKKRNRL